MIWIIIFNFLTKIVVCIEGIKRKKMLPIFGTKKFRFKPVLNAQKIIFYLFFNEKRLNTFFYTLNLYSETISSKKIPKLHFMIMTPITKKSTF